MNHLETFDARVCCYSTYLTNPRRNPSPDKMEIVEFIQQDGWNYEAEKYVRIFNPMDVQLQKFVIAPHRDKTVDEIKSSLKIKLPYGMIFEDQLGERWMAVKFFSFNYKNPLLDPSIPVLIQPKIVMPFKANMNEIIMGDFTRPIHPMTLYLKEDLYLTVNNHQNYIMLLPGTKLVNLRGDVQILEKETLMLIV